MPRPMSSRRGQRETQIAHAWSTCASWECPNSSVSIVGSHVVLRVRGSVVAFHQPTRSRSVYWRAGDLSSLVRSRLRAIGIVLRHERGQWRIDGRPVDPSRWYRRRQSSDDAPATSASAPTVTTTSSATIDALGRPDYAWPDFGADPLAASAEHWRTVFDAWSIAALRVIRRLAPIGSPIGEAACDMLIARGVPDCDRIADPIRVRATLSAQTENTLALYANRVGPFDRGSDIAAIASELLQGRPGTRIAPSMYRLAAAVIGTSDTIQF